MFLKMVFLTVFPNSQQKTCVAVPFYSPCDLLLFSKRLRYRCFLVNFVILLRTLLLQNSSWLLFLSLNSISVIPKNLMLIRERRQLGFVTLNGNLAINLKTTHPPILNKRGQFTFRKKKSSHSSGIVVYPPKFEFLRN